MMNNSMAQVKTRDGKKQAESSQMGEVKIKYTDSSKYIMGDKMELLIRNPSVAQKPESIDIIVNFAMASGETENFSVPLYTGTFQFKAIFSSMPVSV